MKDVQKTQLEEEDQSPPAWIVSFADMITLLLSFFIMLQALAKTRDEALFLYSRDYFNRAIAGLGIPDWLFGKQDKPEFDYFKRKHAATEAPYKYPRRRVIDPEDERIRRAFDDVRRRMETRSGDMAARLVNKWITPIRFAPSSADLSRSSRSYLSNFAVNLDQNLRFKTATVYIVGLAQDGNTDKSRWLLSAHRAHAVQLFLEQARASLGKERQWRFLSWGAGQGGKWRQRLGRIESPIRTRRDGGRLGDRSHIVLVVTGERRGFQTAR